MTRHELKIWPDYFADVVSGSKRYEVRKDDRGFKFDDELLLREYNPYTQVFSGRTCIAKVVHITYGAEAPVEGLLPVATCVMGIEVVK